MTHLTTDVLVVGAGGAGMYAAIAAARAGRSVILLDKGLVGRGGATIMAQMTVAAAIGHEEADDWTLSALSWPPCTLGNNTLAPRRGGSLSHA